MVFFFSLFFALWVIILDEIQNPLFWCKRFLYLFVCLVVQFMSSNLCRGRSAWHHNYYWKWPHYIFPVPWITISHTRRPYAKLRDDILSDDGTGQVCHRTRHARDRTFDSNTIFFFQKIKSREPSRAGTMSSHSSTIKGFLVLGKLWKTWTKAPYFSSHLLLFLK